MDLGSIYKDAPFWLKSIIAIGILISVLSAMIDFVLKIRVLESDSDAPPTTPSGRPSVPTKAEKSKTTQTPPKDPPKEQPETKLRKATPPKETKPSPMMQSHTTGITPGTPPTIKDFTIEEQNGAYICGDIYLRVNSIYIDDTGFPDDKIIISWTGSPKEGKPLEIGAPPLTISDGCAVQLLKTDLGSHSRFAKLEITHQVKGDEND